MDTGWLGGFVLFCFYRRFRIGGALILSAATASGGFLRSFRRYRKEPLALCFTLQQATVDEAFFNEWGCSIGGLDFGYGMAGWFLFLFFGFYEVVIYMVSFIDMFFSHFFSEAKRNARKESAWYVEVIPLTKWLKMAPPSLKRPNSQVCRNLLGVGR